MVESIKMQFLMILTDVLQQLGSAVQTTEKKAKRLIGSRLRFVMEVYLPSCESSRRRQSLLTARKAFDAPSEGVITDHN
jgi:hypothetical protein